ncbi:Hypothetical protein A7982_03954 [Minicystis rosea]|nr:Hypothetical protein A7982_03954 [Minicystis rosea]
MKAVRGACPDDLPLFLRSSATDWIPGGWDLPQSVALAREQDRARSSHPRGARLSGGFRRAHPA